MEALLLWWLHWAPVGCVFVDQQDGETSLVADAEGLHEVRGALPEGSIACRGPHRPAARAPRAEAPILEPRTRLGRMTESPHAER